MSSRPAFWRTANNPSGPGARIFLFACGNFPDRKQNIHD